METKELNKVFTDKLKHEPILFVNKKPMFNSFDEFFNYYKENYKTI